MMTIRLWHRPLVLLAAAMAALALASAVGLAVDDRILVGEPIWLKPFKFSLSIAIYSVTLAWMLSLGRTAPRWVWWLGTTIAAANVIEMVVVVGQVLRGRQSHFNVATPLDAGLWFAMAASIVTLWLANLGIAARLFRERTGDRAATWSVRLGLLLALVGMAFGFLMTSPTPAQLGAMRSGAAVGIVGAHSVGVADDSPGIAITGWSSTGGDLRIPHFVGMHALQAIPLFAWLLITLSRRFPRLADERTRLRLVLVATGTYAGVLAILTWQALRGQSLVHPDGATLTALALLAVGMVASVVAVARHHHVPPAPHSSAGMTGRPVKPRCTRVAAD
ncbi:hypothetical protein [Streptomyces sp. MJM8645]|uniref:hypothetical protein n=2 Tax=Streptomycetaceae TaxID=2062 RepID=UPI0007AF9017|nr:hypothetical protein [Streptomyces sp. MJM8645]